MNRISATLPALGLMLVACGGSQVGSTTASNQLPPAASAESSTSGSTRPTAARPAQMPLSSPPVTRDEAHGWLVAAVGCWLGGVWSDAEGAAEADRIDASKQRCRTLVHRLYDDSDEQSHYEKLRALDQSAIADISAKIATVAQNDAVDRERVEQLQQLLQAIAGAEREAMFARRSANDIKNDIAVAQPSVKRKADELAAVGPLNADEAFEALRVLDLGNLSHEARAIAILYALDRMETARSLPTHLKVYAVARPFAAIFGVASPQVSADASKPIKGGIWLSYLMAVAKAAGHPVPEKAKAHRDQELMAWGGAFMGLADKLGAEAEHFADDGELQRVAKAVARRLGIEYRASEAAIREAPRPGE